MFSTDMVPAFGESTLLRRRDPGTLDLKLISIVVLTVCMVRRSFIDVDAESALEEVTETSSAKALSLALSSSAFSRSLLELLRSLKLSRSCESKSFCSFWYASIFCKTCSIGGSCNFGRAGEEPSVEGVSLRVTMLESAMSVRGELVDSLETACSSETVGIWSGVHCCFTTVSLAPAPALAAMTGIEVDSVSDLTDGFFLSTETCEFSRGDGGAVAVIVVRRRDGQEKKRCQCRQQW